ncbi:ribulose-phosphate 3-epimerase [Desulfovibrio sp. X2]|uniref:ribulose-phosphate 3-epimerase n=1 Tax=Desulfovibrio sp. X2 TaxID=941449 RepID=UPI0003589D4E|nr:ribulose-phosphate 3-epimerase [Desulfovibrio sp. X2]EPR44384.1 ribulose-phosphate 3-epimerase [Desulfovibrio sp. X2]
MERDIILAPSLLSADFTRLGEEMAALEEADIKWAHLDIMDGMYVPNITYGPVMVSALRKKSNLFFDCHLMVEQPERYVVDFAEAGADLICVHAEATKHLERTLSHIEDQGVKPAVALNPATPLEMIKYVLPQCHMVLLMSVNPGFGGQMFIPFVLDKIRELREMIDKAGCKTLIEVDGGVTPENAENIVEAGADVLVSGSAFFKFPPYKKRHELFLFLAKNKFGPTGL